MLKVKLKPERENFKQPIKATEEAACYDCYCAHIEEKEDGLVICYLGFSEEIPKGWKAIIDPRSSIRNTGWVMANGRGTVDSDYRGELQASFRPLLINRLIEVYGTNNLKKAYATPNPFPYKVGDRVCQISWERVNEVEFEITDTLSESNRKGGHGHTGLK